MPAKWGLIEEREDDGHFIAYHVMPMIDVDGEYQASGAHSISKECPCAPILDPCGDLSATVGEKYDDGTLKRWNMWIHHDPEHDGAMSEDEWLRKKSGTAVQ